MTTIQEARELIQSGLTTAWIADSATSGFDLFYDGDNQARPLEDGSSSQPEAFGVSTINEIEATQATLGDRRRYTNEAVAVVQVFARKGDGNRQLDAIAQVAKTFFRSFQDSTSSLWIVDVSTRSVGESGPWKQANVVATFRFQETL